MRRLKDRRGFTLVEVMVSLAVTGLLMSVLGTSFYMLSVTPAAQSDQLTALEDLRYAARWLTRDGQVAQSFAAGTNPDYGTFSWTDYTGSSPVTRSVTYSYSGTQLMRNEYAAGTLGVSQAVARNIAAYDDARFQYIPQAFSMNPGTGLWSLNGGTVTSTITSTVRFTGDMKDQVISTAVVSQLRSQSERTVSSPGNTPTPAPMPGQVVYSCGSINLLQGQYVSGGCAQLDSQDATFYKATASQGGSTKYVTFEITSTVITNTSLTEIDITFMGQSNNAGVLQELYVYNPTDPTKTDGGYHPSISDQGFTFTQRNTNTGSTFPISASDLAYIDSLPTKTLRLKAIASDTASYDLSVDQFTFSVR